MRAITVEEQQTNEVITVKPLLSGPPIKWTHPIKRMLSWVPKLVSYIIFSGDPY